MLQILKDFLTDFKKRTPLKKGAFKPHIKLFLVRSFVHEMFCNFFG